VGGRGQAQKSVLQYTDQHLYSRALCSSTLPISAWFSPMRAWTLCGRGVGVCVCVGGGGGWGAGDGRQQQAKFGLLYSAPTKLQHEQEQQACGSTGCRDAWEEGRAAGTAFLANNSSAAPGHAGPTGQHISDASILPTLSSSWVLSECCRNLADSSDSACGAAAGTWRVTILVSRQCTHWREGSGHVCLHPCIHV
jgi:hypothetical protein